MSRMETTNDTKKRLPDGWRWVRLGEVCEINPRRNTTTRPDNEPTSFVPMEAVDAEKGMICEVRERPFADVKKGYTYFEEGDVLFAKITPCMQNGKHAIARNLIEGIGFASTEFHVIRPAKGILAEWIHPFVRQPAVLHDATNHFTGAVGQQRVPDDFLKSLEIPLPPLSEQRRIAGVLREQMAAVEKARAAAQAQLKVVKTLPASLLRQVFPQTGQPLPDGWRWVKLGEVCQDISDGTHFTPTYVFEGVPFLSVKDVREERLSFIDCRYITKEQHHNFCRRCKPEKGDVLYTKVGTTGIAKAIDIDVEFSIFVSVALLKLQSTIVPNYLEKVLNAPVCRTQAENLTQGMANRNLVLKDLKLIMLPLPPLDEQQRIAAVLCKQMAAVEKAREAAEEELQTINALPAALLRRAFNGEI
jgi:type I restriction enzyme S subunit